MQAKKWFQNILAVLILVAISLPIIITQRIDKRNLQSNGKETIGTIVGFGRRGSVIWEYSLEGQTYKIHDWGNAVNGLQKGERFLALVNPKDTKTVTLYYHKPYFGTDSVDTTVISSFPHGRPKDENVFAIYNYSVSGIEHERWQKIPYGEARNELLSTDSFFCNLLREKARNWIFVPGG